MKIDLDQCTGLELSIIRAYRIKKKRNWDRLFFAVDLHDTITWSTYTKDEAKQKIFFPAAIKALRYFSTCKEIVLILHTASYKEYLQDYYKEFEANGIHFNYLNENPEVPSTSMGDFGRKFYYNLSLDDKSGFNPMKDWAIVYHMVRVFEEDKGQLFLHGDNSEIIVDNFLNFK